MPHIVIGSYVHQLRKWIGVKDSSSQENLEILVRNRRNSFYVASVYGSHNIGSAIYVNPSFFNHSCR